jgi:RNA polymerase sigma factor (sigma-70 family)
MLPAEPKSSLQLYFDAVTQCPVPTHKQEIEWFSEYEKLPPGKEKIALKGQIAKGYLRFVIKKARNRTNQEELLEDLIGEGNIGLLHAIDRFRISYNTRFLTFGAFWIEVKMQEFLNRRSVHIPQQTVKDQRKLKRKEDDEIAKGLRDQYSFTEVTVTSLEKLVLPSAHTSEDETNSPNLINYMIKAGISLRDRLILILFYGLRGGTPKKLDEILTILYVIEGTLYQREHLRKIKDLAIEALTDYLKD